MRLSIRSASFVVLASLAALPVLVGCTAESETTTPTSQSPQGSESPTEPGTTETPAPATTAPAATSCDAAPALSGAKTLSALSSAEKGQLCDYSACPFGGYGKSKACSGGVSTKSKASQAACLGDATWTKCGSLKVSDYLACQEKLNADPCASLQTLMGDAACAPIKACAFGG